MIGFFDSGFGGLTVLKHVVKALPQYDYLYLGDNARVPYGSRSDASCSNSPDRRSSTFQTGLRAHNNRLQYASAKALRKIQQEYLPVNIPGPQGAGGRNPHGRGGRGADQRPQNRGPGDGRGRCVGLLCRGNQKTQSRQSRYTSRPARFSCP